MNLYEIGSDSDLGFYIKFIPKVIAIIAIGLLQLLYAIITSIVRTKKFKYEEMKKWEEVDDKSALRAHKPKTRINQVLISKKNEQDSSIDVLYDRKSGVFRGEEIPYDLQIKILSNEKELPAGIRGANIKSVDSSDYCSFLEFHIQKIDETDLLKELKILAPRWLALTLKKIK